MVELTAMIVDDEPDAIDVLQSLIKRHCPDVLTIATANTVDDGLELLGQKMPDVLFLDIQMPRKNGFDLLRQVHDDSFHTVFVSAHESYAVEAVKFHAMDYLLKPINSVLLKEVVERIKDKIAAKKELDYKALLNNLGEKMQHRIAIPIGNGYQFIACEQIIRIQASGNYSTLFTTTSDKPILVIRKLKQFETLLDAYGFVRVHNSHLINPVHINGFDKRDRGTLVMSDEMEIALGPSYRASVLDFLRIKFNIGN